MTDRDFTAKTQEQEQLEQHVRMPRQVHEINQSEPVLPAVVLENGHIGETSSSINNDGGVAAAAITRPGFATGLCECWTDAAVCCNSTFMPCMMAARQQNMLRELAEEPNALVRTPSGGLVENRTVAEQIAYRITSYNACCALAMVADVGRLISGMWWPYGLASLHCLPGVCLQNISVRSMVRQRMQIDPHTCADVAVSWCCAPCAVGQQYLEMARAGIDPLLVVGTSSKAAQYQHEASHPKTVGMF